MIESIRVRTVLFAGFLAFCVIYLLPTLVQLPKGWWFNRKKLSYGLDIQGGAHLVYSVDVNGVLTERTDRMARMLAIEFKDKGAEMESVVPNAAHDAILIKAKSDAD